MAYIKRFQLQIGIALILLSVSHWFPMGIQFLELAMAFAHFSIFLSVVAAAYSLYLGLWKLVLTALVSSCLAMGLVVPHLISNTIAAVGPVISVGQYNIYHHNPQIEATIDALINSNCDILSIQEVNSAWSDQFSNRLAVSYPYSIMEPWSNCCYGIAVFSKYPIKHSEIIYIDEIPLIVATIKIDSLNLTIISAHTQAPAFPNETETRNNQLRKLSDLINKESSGIVVLGDFNVVPWDKVFRRFEQKSGLKRVQDGFCATFPTDAGVPLIPIDHVLVSKDLLPVAISTTWAPGSDHRGIKADISLKENAKMFD